MVYPKSLLVLGIESYTIKRHESGVKVKDLSREFGISVGTFYNWRSKYACLVVGRTTL